MNHHNPYASPRIMKPILAIMIVTIVIRLLSLGMYPLIDPTESRYGEIARKMVVTGNWVTPLIEDNDGDITHKMIAEGYTPPPALIKDSAPFWAKPPLSFWMTAISYKLFGINDFAARLPSFIAMMAGAMLTYLFARKLYNKDTARVTLAIIISFPLFFYMAGGVMTDPSLFFCTTLTMMSFWLALHEENRLWGYLFFVALGIALLAKGPIGIVLSGMPIGIWVLWKNKWLAVWKKFPWITGIIIMLAIAAPWYLMEESRTPGFIKYFIIGEHWQRYTIKGWKGDLYGAGRSKPLGSIWYYGIAAVLPFSLALIPAAFKRSIRQALFRESIIHNEWLLYLWLWIILPLIFFTFAKNITMAYVIVSLPAAALVITHSLTTLPYSRILPAMLSFSAILAIILLIFIQFPMGANLMKEQKHIIARYNQLRSSATSQLIYLVDRPYSADFYSQGSTLYAKTEADAIPYMKEGNFFAVTKNNYVIFSPSFKEQMRTVADQQNTLLFTVKSKE